MDIGWADDLHTAFQSSYEFHFIFLSEILWVIIHLFVGHVGH